MYVIKKLIFLSAFFLLTFYPYSVEEDGLLLVYRDDLSLEDSFRVSAITKHAKDFSKIETFERMQGGAGTSQKKPDRHAFSYPVANMTFDQEMLFRLGDGLFKKIWISAPSSAEASDGLGPLFNARSCQSCHLKDGRGHPPEGQNDATSMFLRLAREPQNEQEKISQIRKNTLNFEDPVYGGQLQDIAVPGLKAEGRMVIEYKEIPFQFSDGIKISVRKPKYSVSDLGYGSLNRKTTLSPRVAPPMIGLGLIEQIHSADILSLADPYDKDKDGISGKPNIVRDKSGKITLGRFGWKAQTASVRQQSAGAFAGDIGISTPDVPLHWGDCTEKQKECKSLPAGVEGYPDSFEASSHVMDLVAFYSENLAVPVRRDANTSNVLAGKKIFYEIGCASCHTPKFVTHRYSPNKQHAFQLIWPYSDFLLHDMGEGLADGQIVGEATGREWRTPPLWGIGLTKTVNGHNFFLHDGRARNLTEAIVWHGGEAQKARDRFAHLLQEERNLLIAFLESL